MGHANLVGATETVSSEYSIIKGKPANDANVTEMIRFGPTPGMPAFRYTLTEDEISDVVEFLKVEQEAFGRPAQGATDSALLCTTY